MAWLEQRAVEGARGGPLQLMYGIDGRHELPEEILDHLDGYRGSRPVRVGNAAAEQLQLDIYGELMDSVYLYDKYGSPIAYDLWCHLRGMLDWVADNWERADEGIWEVRGGPQQFVYSKVQCWVALDRACGWRRSGACRWTAPAWPPSATASTRRSWRAAGTRSGRRFVQHFGTDALDAANLIMPLVHFLSPTDPRMLGTLDRTMEELVSDSLVYRYEIGKGAGDGLTGGEGTFNMCTFWLVEALARAGRLEEARFIFEKMLTYANHLGLYAEEIGPARRGAGQLPAGLHAHGADQRRVQPGPPARRGALSGSDHERAGRLPRDFRRGLGGGAFEQRSAPAPPRRVCPGRDRPGGDRGCARPRRGPQDPVGFVRVWAAAAFARVAPPGGDSVAVLIAEMGDELAFVRSLAAWHLGRLGRAFPGIEQALLPLRQLAGDKDPSVRVEAALALGMLEGKGAPPPELKSLSIEPPAASPRADLFALLQQNWGLELTFDEVQAPVRVGFTKEST